MSTVAVTAVAGAGGCLLLALLILRRQRRDRGPPPLSDAELTGLDGARVLVTGAGAGIGAALVRRLVATGRPAAVIAACRRRRFLGAASDADSVVGAVRQLPLDLSSLASVRGFVSRLRDVLGPDGRLTHLVCNAGVFYPAEPLSADGLPTHAAVNFVGHLALTRWLLSNGIVQPGYTRIILVSSSLSRRGVAREATDVAKASSARAGYADSKQCLNLLAQHLHVNCGLHTCAAFTGGPVATEVLLPPRLPAPLRPPALWLMSLAFKSPERVAEDLLGLMVCRRGRPGDSDTSSGRVFSAGQPVAWPVVMEPGRLAEFMAGYERLVDSLAPKVS